MTEKFERIFSRLSNRGKLTEADVRSTMREVRRALLEADVNFKVAKEFTARAQEKAMGEEVLRSFTASQQIVKIVHEELTRILGGSPSPFQLTRSFSSVMVVGLQGSGKTTFCAKLGLLLRRQGRKPMLVALDVQRPAAAEQLEILGQQAGIPVFKDRGGEVVTLYRAARQAARAALCDTMILDTAGRLHVDEEMMGELARLQDEARPEEVLLVLDSMTGQEALTVAESFQGTVAPTGVVLTKLDGDARGGAALSVTAVTGTRIKFAGTGEKLSDLEVFNPERMAGRILGMGDVLTLIEKVRDSMDQERAHELEKRMRERSFTLEDFLVELKRLRNMGPLDQILAMLPGVPKSALRGLDVDERKFIEAEAIINSMTREERMRPEIINGSRRKRIARGSGTRVQSINRLLKQFQEMRRMMKVLGRGGQRRFKLPFLGT